jgi:terminase large subunit-like protein
MLSIAQDTSLTLDPAELFRLAVGGDPDPWQERVLLSQAETALRKLVLCCSRQAGKSTVVAILVLWFALFAHPGYTVLILAPAQRQSAEMFATIMKFYRRFSSSADDDPEAESKLSVTFANGSRILALPGNSDGDTIRCYTADLIVCDEAARIPLETIASVRPMLATKKDGRLVILSSARWASGWYHDIMEGDDPSWQREKITALSCPRISAEFLESELREMGQVVFDMEYMCKFRDPAASLFGAEVLEAALSDEIQTINW